jgi:hypothetical protein
MESYIYIYEKNEKEDEPCLVYFYSFDKCTFKETVMK